MKESEVAEMIIEALKANDVKATKSHTAAGGIDWGHVQAWEITPNGGKYAIMYGNNGQTDYALADDIEDLACWLLEDGDGCGNLEAIANARNEDPDEVAGDYEGAVRIIRRCDYYGPTCNYEYITDDNDCQPQEWTTVAEAQEWIDDKESETYHTAHNEVGRPTYFVVEA